eukprot:3932025-Rhodomonas_salina.4
MPDHRNAALGARLQPRCQGINARVQRLGGLAPLILPAVGNALRGQQRHVSLGSGCQLLLAQAPTLAQRCQVKHHLRARLHFVEKVREPRAGAARVAAPKQASVALARLCYYSHLHAASCALPVPKSVPL